MSKVKFCGIKRREDIEYINILKPDYVGFVFAESKREISLNKGRELIKSLNKDIKKVGVFVDESPLRVMEIAKKLELHVLQFHGMEDLNYLKEFHDFEIWKGIRVKGGQDFKLIDMYKNYGVLLDAFVEGESGGTGKRFSWETSKILPFDIKLILAGGLNSENVLEGIEKFKPYVVDVSSSIETNGFKDFNKMKKFIERVRENNEK